MILLKLTYKINFLKRTVKEIIKLSNTFELEHT